MDRHFENGDRRDACPTGLPLFRTWGGVYLFAFVCFVLYVVLLTVFSQAFS
jgi:hypothetical protein